MKIRMKDQSQKDQDEKDQDEKDQERARFLLGYMKEEVFTGQFNDWEDNFIESLLNHLSANPNYQFSQKQIEVLEKIWKKG
jgi:hypothetical protein